MTIHSEHPFAVPESERDPVRRLRGRVGATVSLWTSGDEDERRGLTVSSYAVATGDPGHLIALLDPDSALVDTLLRTRIAVVQLLSWEHRTIADAFAGEFPAPGGAWRLGEWKQTTWGPRLIGASTWLGVRVTDDEPHEIGWSVLVDGVIEHVQLADDAAPLVHRHGRYVKPH